MKQEDYRKAMDSLSFSNDFQMRTKALLLERVREAEKERTIMHIGRNKRMVAAMAAALAALTVSVSAAVMYLSPADVAERADMPALAEAFQSADAVRIGESKQVGDYTVTLEGLVSGKELAGHTEEVSRDRTYTVFAIANTDGAALTELPELAYTPLVGGYNVCAVNAWTLGGGYTAFAESGVYYYLFDTESVEMFADHPVYFAIYEGGAPSAETFSMREDGTIEMRADVKGALFSLPLDADGADPAAAKAFAEGTGFDYAPVTDAERTARAAEEEPKADISEGSDGSRTITLRAEEEPKDEDGGTSFH